MAQTDLINEGLLDAYHDELMKTHLVGGVVFDISAHNATGTPPVLATYANLAAALGANGANVPEAMRAPGMSIKYVQSSDNKYVQFRYMSSSTAAADFTNVANWQGVDDEPTAGSNNLVKSGGVYNSAVAGKSMIMVSETDFIVGKTIKAADGSLVTESYSTNTTISTFAVNESLIYYGLFYCNGSTNDLAIAFYDASDNFINSSNNIKGTDYTTGSHWGSITPPANAAKVRIVKNDRQHTTLYRILYVDKELDINSNLPVANKVIAQALANLSVDGYLYQGIATANTNPGTPTSKVFYFAQNAGTYTNFNGLVVNRGLAILKYNNGWTLDQLLVTDDFITDSTNIPFSSAVKNSSILVEKKSTDMVSGKYLNKNGALVDGASAVRYNYSFDIIAKRTYIVYGYTESASPNYVVFACYDADGNNIPFIIDINRSASSGRAYLSFLAPTGAVKCIVHSNNFVARLWESNEMFFDSVPTMNSKKLIHSDAVWGVYEGSTKKIASINYVTSKLINSQGEVITGSGNIHTYEISQNKRYLVYAAKVADTSYLNVAFYNGDTFISGALSPYTASGGKYFLVQSPANADTMRIWSNSTYPDELYEASVTTDAVTLNDGRVVSSHGVAQAINPLDTRIGNLESIMNVPNEISVKKDGTGDYSTLRAAIDYAKEHTPITIKIYPGTYNLSDEYTAEEINSASLDGFCGWDIWNGINLKGISNNRADIVLHAEASLDDTPSTARQAISTLNLRGNNKIENLTITSRNIRYPIHDDFSSNTNKTHEIVNCYIESYFPYYWDGAWNGIGYGAQKGKKLYVDGCEVYPSIMCHNGNQAGGSDVIIKDTKTKILSLESYADMDMDRYQLYNVSYHMLRLTGANTNSFNVVSVHNSEGVIRCRVQDKYITEEVQKFSRVSITASIGQAAYINSDFNLASTGTFCGIYIADISNENALVQTRGIISENKLGGVDTTTWNVGDELSVGSNGKLEKSSTNVVAKVKYIIGNLKYVELL